MANGVVDFQSRRAARDAEHAQYEARHKQIAALFKMLESVIARVQELGANNQVIARGLRSIAEELLNVGVPETVGTTSLTLKVSAEPCLPPEAVRAATHQGSEGMSGPVTPPPKQPASAARLKSARPTSRTATSTHSSGPAPPQALSIW